MITAFIDESGDLGFPKKGSKHFVICVILTKSPEDVRRAIRKVRDTIPTKKKISELKWHHSDDLIRKRTLNRLAGLLVEVHLLILDKQTVYDYLQNKKDKLYNYLVGLIFNHTIFDERTVEIIFDARSNNKFIRADLDQYVQKQILASRPGLKITVTHKRSTDDRGLQAAVLIAGATLRKYDTTDDSFIEIIRTKITTEKKSFK